MRLKHISEVLDEDLKTVEAVFGADGEQAKGYTY